MNLSERIAAIIKVNQHSPATFADAIGVQRSSISHILNGRNKPSIDFLEKVLIHFPRVDAGWLITGKTPSHNEAQGTQLPTQVMDEHTDLNMSPLEQTLAHANKKPEKSIERIVVFYTDRTFSTYEQNE